MKRSLFILAYFSLISFSAQAEKPPYAAECKPTNPAEKKFTLHFDLKEKSVFEPKEKEPIWIDYNEDIGKFTVCQQKSQYVPLFLGSLVDLLNKPNFKKESLSIGKLKIDPLSSPFVCVSFSKKGYEYVGAFVLEHERNRFPSPNDNKYGMIFLPLEGKAVDSQLGKPVIPTSSIEKSRRVSSASLRKHALKRGKATPKVKPTLPLWAKTKTFDCQSLGGGGDMPETAPKEAPVEGIEAPVLSE